MTTFFRASIFALAISTALSGTTVAVLSKEKTRSPLDACLQEIARPTNIDATFELCLYPGNSGNLPSRSEMLRIVDFYANNFIAVQAWPAMADWLRPLAQDGDPEALYRLAGTFAPGNPQGLALYVLAAKQGSDDAQFQLARLYYEGKYVAMDRNAASALLSDLSNRGYSPASDVLHYQEMLANGYGFGRGQAESEAAMVLGAIVLGFVAFAIANPDLGNSGKTSNTQQDPCEGSADAFAWSGFDMNVAAAIALGGCSAF